MGEFIEAIQGYTVAEIVEALNAPRGTIYFWKMGKRRPPEWLEPHLLRVLKERFPEPRKPQD